MGLLQGNPFLSSSLINMYAKCGDLTKAQHVFEELSARDLVSWNTLISGYTLQGKGHEALNCFERLKNEGLFPDVVTFTCILKACGIIGAMGKGKQIHEDILNKGLLERDIVLGNALVNMYAKCGDLGKARNVLEELPFRDVVSYSTLIARLSQQGKVYEAFTCFDQMQNKGIFPNVVTFICVLKACGSIRSIEKGKQIHLQIFWLGLLHKDIVLGTALVDMYGKCSALANAKQVLKELPILNAISWSALIAGYAQQGQGLEALDCFERMQNEGISPNLAIFICILKACGNIGAIDKGKEIHNKIVNLGLLEKDVILGTALVDMYAKCGDLPKAQHVLGELPVRDIVSWNALIAGYSQQGKDTEALNSFEEILCEGLSPNVTTFVCTLKACASTGAIEKGEQIHDEIMTRGFLDKDSILGNALVDMYGKCGDLARAKEVFEELPVRNLVSWNILLSGYVQQGKCQEALNCFEDMQRESLFPPDAITYICLLKACGGTRSINKGIQIHEEILHEGLLEKDIALRNALLDMYVKCGFLAKAQQVLERLPIRNVVSWNALIAGYVEHGLPDKAMHCFEQMQSEGLFPDVVTFISILKACGSARALEKGRQCHEIILTCNLLGKDIILQNALIDMYVKCGLLTKALEIFNEIPTRSIVSWSTLIAGYTQLGECREALNYFEQMLSEGICPDVITFIFMLRTCGNMMAIGKGKKIHASIVSSGLLEKDIVLATALVDMYSKCGVPAKAQQILEELPVRNSFIWSALIGGYTQQGQGHEALHCFERMQSEGMSPDAVTFTCALTACGNIGSMDKGQNLHDEISVIGLLGKDLVVGNALVNMYAKCGVLAKAQQVLKDFSTKDIVPWNVIIVGYAEQGLVCKALSCFYFMQNQGIHPDEVTFVCILSACGHVGLLTEAESIFADMITKYSTVPTLEHYTCMVMAFGCTGHFDKAMEVIKAMPLHYHSAVWLALLSACRRWGNVKLGRLVFDQILQVDITCAAAYVNKAATFAATGMQEDA